MQNYRVKGLPSPKNPNGSDYKFVAHEDNYHPASYSPDPLQYTKPMASDLRRMGTRGRKGDYHGV